MKNLFKLFSFFTLLAVATGCLKDEAFENGEYGTQIREVKGVAFPQASMGTVSLAITSQSESQTSTDLEITLEQDGNAESDVSVTIQVDNALIAGMGYTQFPGGAFNVPATIIIPKGQKRAVVPIVFPNTSTLDPTQTYAIGFRITAVSAGYQIAANQKQVVLTFSVKNKWDGVYDVLDGKVQRYSSPGVPTVGDALNGSLANNPDIVLTTIDPTTVEITNHKWASGGAIGGIDNLRAKIDPSTNLVTLFALGNTTLTAWTGGSLVKQSRYDPATKTMYLAFRWNPSAAVREYEIIAKFRRPR